jgi:hypothetical protein
MPYSSDWAEIAKTFHALQNMLTLSLYLVSKMGLGRKESMRKGRGGTNESGSSN